ncbi:MAG: FtsQ-type POTRA domain-containing protein [Kiritimatiellae bacterium]|nr:FtsQ-type POTRA domain-containing protein [Kiritimatiellia bacterium]
MRTKTPKTKSPKNIKESAKRAYSVKIAIVLIFMLALVVIAINALHKVWLEQCVVTNAAEQIRIQSGKMIKAELLADICKLKNGINLALIDYAKLREDALKALPNLKSVTFRRRLPDKLFVTIEERVPVARMGISGKNAPTGLVTDNEGVIFRKQRNTSSLPLIRELGPLSTLPGKKLGPRAMAAIGMIDALRAPEFTELSILVADISNQDYILVTFKQDYSEAKIAWAEMDLGTPSATANLLRQLRHLRDAKRVVPGAVMWNATDISTPGKIYAETKRITR